MLVRHAVSPPPRAQLRSFSHRQITECLGRHHFVGSAVLLRHGELCNYFANAIANSPGRARDAQSRLLRQMREALSVSEPDRLAKAARSWEKYKTFCAGMWKLFHSLQTSMSMGDSQWSVTVACMRLFKEDVFERHVGDLLSSMRALVERTQAGDDVAVRVARAVARADVL